MPSPVPRVSSARAKNSARHGAIMSPVRVALLISIVALPSLRLAAQTAAASTPVAATQSSPAQPAGAGPSAASDQITTLHATARLVVLDVVVVDGDGHPVHGLKSSDFALTE